MGRSKKVKQEFSPPQKEVRERENPAAIYDKNPSWSFSGVDRGGRWAFSKARLGDAFWEKILPKLSAFEKMTWRDILMEAKKQHHHVPVTGMNKEAADRLNELHVFQEELLSLRLEGKLRLYGYLSEAVFVILWYDDDHGDNGTCVFRSHKKHT